MIEHDRSVRNPITVYVHGRITESTAKAFAVDMQRAKDTGQPVIPIVISTYGGSVYALLEMIDTIKSIDVPVATIVTGKAMSAGAVLASCGTEGLRFASPYSTYMIHEITSSASGKIKEIEVDTEETKRLNNLLMQIMATNIGKRPDYFLDMVQKKGHADWYFTPKQAKWHGLANHIKVPDVRININVKMVIR